MHLPAIALVSTVALAGCLDYGSLVQGVDPPPIFSLVEVTLEKSSIVLGETAVLTARLGNTGPVEGTLPVYLRAAGMPVGEARLTIKPGTVEAARLEFKPDSAGRWSLTLLAGALQANVTLTVLKPADLRVVDLKLNADSIERGESAIVTVEVENRGEVEGEDAVELFLDGQSVARETVTVPAGDRVQKILRSEPTSGGKLVLVAKVAKSERSSILHVRSPIISNPTFSHNDPWCADTMAWTVGFTNTGDGIARKVAATIAVYDEANGAKVDERTAETGPVLPGKAGSISMSLHVPDKTCGGADWYTATVTVKPPFGEPLTVETGRFDT